MTIAFDAPIAFDSPVFTFDGVGTAVTETSFVIASIDSPTFRLAIYAPAWAALSSDGRVSVFQGSRVSFDQTATATVRE